MAISDEQLVRALRNLDRRVKELERSVAELREQQATPAAEFRFEPLPEQPPVVTTDAAAASAPVASPATTESMENAIGSRWLGRIGIIALVIGIGYFLQYSFSRDWFGPTAKVGMGLAAGLLLIGAGDWCQHRKGWPRYGQLLAGGGLAVLYLASYASYAFYALIPAAAATPVLMAITAGGILLAVRNQALFLALLALGGGYLTPVMLATGENRPVALFGYLLLLDVAALAILAYRRWTSLALAALAGTALLYGGWHLRFFTPDQAPLARGVVLVFFLLFNAYLLLDLRQRRTDTDAADIVEPLLAITSVAGLVLAICWQQEGANDWVVKGWVSGLAIGELLLAAIAGALDERREQPLRLTAATLAALLAILATSLILEGRTQTIALGGELLALVWLGLRLRLCPLRSVGLLLVPLLLVRFLLEMDYQLPPFASFVPLVNARGLAGLASVAALHGALWLMQRQRQELGADEAKLLPALLVCGQLLMLLVLSVELFDCFRFQLLHGGRHAEQLALSVLWGSYAALLVSAGFFRPQQLLRLLGMTLLGITILKVFLFDLSFLETPYRIGSFLVLGGLLLAVSYGYNRYRHRLFPPQN